jgi:pseudouridine-5'-monophosphatase
LSKRTAIVFDMDGLMVDTEPLSHQAWNELLRPYGHTLTDEMIQQMIGLRAEVSSQFVIDTFGLPLSVAEIIPRRAAIYAGIRARGVPVMPGLIALQEQIAARRMPWGVATSSPREHAQEILAQLGLSTACQAIAAGDEVKRGKPAPDIYLLAAERLGVAPEQCLALEDSGPGSQAAVAAGMLTVAVPNGHTKTADFSHVHYIYTSLHDVARNLDVLLG